MDNFFTIQDSVLKYELKKTAVDNLYLQVSDILKELKTRKVQYYNQKLYSIGTNIVESAAKYAEIKLKLVDITNKEMYDTHKNILLEIVDNIELQIQNISNIETKLLDLSESLKSNNFKNIETPKVYDKKNISEDRDIEVFVSNYKPVLKNESLITKYLVSKIPTLITIGILMMLSVSDSITLIPNFIMSFISDTSSVVAYSEPTNISMFLGMISKLIGVSAILTLLAIVFSINIDILYISLPVLRETPIFQKLFEKNGVKYLDMKLNIGDEVLYYEEKLKLFRAQEILNALIKHNKFSNLDVLYDLNMILKEKNELSVLTLNDIYAIKYVELIYTILNIKGLNEESNLLIHGCGRLDTLNIKILFLRRKLGLF